MLSYAFLIPATLHVVGDSVFSNQVVQFDGAVQDVGFVYVSAYPSGAPAANVMVHFNIPYVSGPPKFASPDPFLCRHSAACGDAHKPSLRLQDGHLWRCYRV